jgi:hypothetical protein
MLDTLRNLNFKILYLIGHIPMEFWQKIKKSHRPCHQTIGIYRGILTEAKISNMLIDSKMMYLHHSEDSSKWPSAANLLFSPHCASICALVPLTGNPPHPRSSKVKPHKHFLISFIRPFTQIFRISQSVLRRSHG